MKKKILAMLMVFVLTICTLPSYADVEIKVYFSMSRYGELLEGKRGEVMAYVPVVLSGKGSYNLDDFFKTAHGIYHPEGEEGYLSGVSEWGLGVEKLWGDMSYNFGYQLNGGRETVMGLEHQVENGDFIDACIYKNLYPDTEGYARFDKQETEVSVSEEITLTLEYASGYDEDWNVLYSPCEGASVLLNGEENEVLTGENGEITLSFEEKGTYIVSAKKNKMLEEESVPAITAPVCKIVVTDPRERLVHGIAKMYAESDLSAAGGNLPWILADMAAYEEVFGESGNIMSDKKKEEALSLMVDFAAEAEKPGDLAKSILGLRALGCDTRRIFTKDFKHIDLVGKLMALVESGDAAVTNIYTLPYVLIALGQTEEGLEDNLISEALEKKEEWQSVENGTDALTPMICALAPYAESREEVSAVIEETVEILKGEMREDGLIDGFEGYEAASTGLAIWALSSAGINAENVVCGEKSLIDGILSVKNEQENGFPNAFATEQGFRGLLGWFSLTEKNEKEIYNFSDYEEHEINFTGADFCPVQFELSPSNATISLESGEIISGNLYDLPSGEHTVLVSAPLHSSKTETFTVTEEDEDKHILKSISISLSRESYGGGGGSYVPPKKPEKEPGKPDEKPEEKPIDITEVFKDIESDAWYFESVRYVYEKGLFGGTDKGFEPDSFMTRGMLVTVLCRLGDGKRDQSLSKFSDVESDAWYAEGVLWATENGIVQGVTENSFAPNENITREQLGVILYRYALHLGVEVPQKTKLQFEDIDKISPYAEEAINFAVGMGVISGKGNNMLCPRDRASRAEVATMLMRFAEAVK